MPTINQQRLLDDLHQLRSFGAHGNGVVRTALSNVDLESRNWLQQKFGEAGLDARIDSIIWRSTEPHLWETGVQRRLEVLRRYHQAGGIIWGVQDQLRRVGAATLYIEDQSFEAVRIDVVAIVREVRR